MPRMTLAQTLTVNAGAVTANLAAGQLYEFISKPTKLVIGAAAAAAGINMTVSVGGILLMNDQPISQANVFPRIPDDIALVEMVRGGRLILTLRNSTGGNIVVNGVFVDLT